jgi:hypothetical protein
MISAELFLLVAGIAGVSLVLGLAGYLMELFIND